MTGVVDHCRALLDAGLPIPPYWQRVLVDDFERMQFAVGEPADHQPRYTVEPAHAYARFGDGVPGPDFVKHLQLHSRVVHYHPHERIPDAVAVVPDYDWVRLKPGDLPSRVIVGYPAYIRVGGLPGWPGWTFDIPADWDPGVPLPCPEEAICYTAEEIDGEIVLNEPPVPDGWTRREYHWWEVAHAPPSIETGPWFPHDQPPPPPAEDAEEVLAWSNWSFTATAPIPDGWVDVFRPSFVDRWNLRLAATLGAIGGIAILAAIVDLT